MTGDESAEVVQRDLDSADFSIITMGLDIGSSTTHFVLAQLRMELRGSRYVVGQRRVLFTSDVLLTPYRDAELIDAEQLEAFLSAQHQKAGVPRTKIETGAVILTGLALDVQNAKHIGEMVARESGQFVVASAGDNLEAMLAARGSGALGLSAREGARILHIDIGGGTAKFALCDRGAILATAAMDVGARHVVLAKDGRINSLSATAERLGRDLGLALAVGSKPPLGDVDVLVRYMAAQVANVAAGGRAALEASSLTRRGSLPPAVGTRKVSFSGGVAEYLYGRTRTVYQDQGMALASEIQTALRSRDLELVEMPNGIRSTVLGASQHTVQASSQTIFVTSSRSLPLRNVPLIVPRLPLSSERLVKHEIAKVVREALLSTGASDSEQPIAIGIQWEGSVTPSRLEALTDGLSEAMHGSWSPEVPAVVVIDADIGGIVGRWLQEHGQDAYPVVCIDGIDVGDFDFIDIATEDRKRGGTTVVVKSLEFDTGAESRVGAS